MEPEMLLFIAGIVVSILLNILIVFVILSKGSKINYMDIIMISFSISDILQAGIGYMIELHTFYTLKTSGSSVMPPLTTAKALSITTIVMATAKAPITSSPSITSLFTTSTPPAPPEADVVDAGCKVSGFTVTFLALTSIFHLTGISIERRFILHCPLRARMWMQRRVIALYIILPSWLCGLSWAMCPLIGWNSYIREDGDVYRCSIKIQGNDANHLSYSYNLLFWCYVLPIIVMVYCCNDVRITLKQLHQQGVNLGVARETVCMRKKMEKRLTAMSVVMIVTFLLAWTPYTMCLFAITWNVHVPSTLFSFSAVFGKLSTLYNPVVYVIFMKDFRMKLRLMFRLASTNSVSLQPRTQSPSMICSSTE